MKDIDWSKAPKGTTHAFPPSEVSPWRKVEGRVAYKWKFETWILVGPGAAISAYLPRPCDWDKNSLPPIGVECEVDYDGWKICNIIGHFSQPYGPNAAFTITGPDGKKFVDACGAEAFRPVRTPEQIAADGKAAVIEDMAKVVNARGPFVRGLAALYDAGYRKVQP